MNMDAKRNAAVHSAYVPLRIVFGLVPILAGLDKFANVLADWKSYIAPWAEQLLPVSPSVFLAIVGVVEIAVGVLVWTRFVRVGAFAAAAWLTLVAINLLMAGFKDIAVRDLVLAVAAFSLGRLSDALPSERPAEVSSAPRKSEPARV
jgi:uncharacterized membrane protein YphA (DoxX/SURF4 family)